ncbi:dihydroorotate oxidase [Streptococcus sp. A11]|uniref:dihydroorotate oxidase n=1 Tax=Streptococcus sp. A11 TaxID=3373124 RepID=UPI00374D06CB
MVSTATTLGGFSFDNCLMNAAGVWCMTKEELDGVKNSAAGTFVTKTATLEYREGNPEPRYKNIPLGSINSMGLPNQGLDYYLDYLLELQEEEPERTFVLSLVGMSPDETHTILKKVQDSAFKGLVELNLSCPNVPGKPQIAYDFETTETILREVFAYFTKPLGIKLPPYFDIVHFDQAAAIFNQFPLKFVNCVNSIGNGLYIEDESVIIKPKNGFGGIGGEYIKPTALANVHAFYQRLKPEIQIVGTGGVLTGRDAFEHILCGASMVQIGTTLQKEGLAAFDRITQELRDIMAEKGYETIEDFRGKLHHLDDLT